ncbi:MAG: hypothetical protein ACRBCK_04600 [Alphaproteobacteria bacterium]
MFSSIIRTYISFSFLLLSASCASIENRHSFPLNIPYHEARSAIIKHGWRPVVGEKKRDNVGKRISYFHTQGYIEIDDCAGTGAGYCAFHFQSGNGDFLIVTTQEAPLNGHNSNLNNPDDAIVVNYSIVDSLN